MLDNNAVATFVLALHNKANGALSPSDDIDLSEHECGSRSRLVVRVGEAAMVTYYDGFSVSVPYRTVLKQSGKIVFSHFYTTGVRTNHLSDTHSNAIASTLANPGSSWNVSRSLVALR